MVIREQRGPRFRDEQGRKQCRGCGQWLQEGAFTLNRSTADGRQSHCPRCVRNRRLWYRYGITGAQYDDLLAEQGGVCAICKATNPGGKELAVDHDHACCPERSKSCGECVRGLLCDLCNVGIGSLRDDTEILRAAVEYLTAA
ncbi:endonuclease VII domain-containing protein [Streptomyces sp. MH60]|uniref:endonuclease VII domain-containing protein n=1 Tax=Streptomyces sp. MH60 TaxID=1940758 RepID=UPI000CEE673B